MLLKFSTVQTVMGPSKFQEIANFAESTNKIDSVSDKFKSLSLLLELFLFPFLRQNLFHYSTSAVPKQN